MIKYEKMHTIELSESELARALFVMRLVNGGVWGRPLAFQAFDKLGVGVRMIGEDAVRSKVNELAKKIGAGTCIDYHYIQNEWESFLGVGEEVKNRGILVKIANMEKELAELRGML